VLDENPPLGARRVVLGKLADAVEEPRTDFVVEVLGWKFLERPRQAVEDIVSQRALLARA
jgi:hypothetical protein